ncbi:MAG TPA: CBS domain-containing protein [Pirellulaceae bacterium]|nr:CBS domain-containing protein [Pirellulaceae bacterium]
MSAGRICIREVDTADVTESVQSAADRMNARNVGTLVVLNPERQPLGIVTDRDLTVRVLARGKDPLATTVGDVMTLFPRTVYEETSIEDAISLMRVGPFRRVPVVDREGKLVGLLSIDDVLELLAEEFRDIGQLLKAERPEVLAKV